MGDTGELFTAHFVISCIFQTVALSSEQFTVNGLQSPILAQLGGKLELTCELSPPQQAKHMEIRWFRDRYTEPVYLYRTGKDLLGEIISKYVERTELLKDDIENGKVTLRISNVTAADDGPYRCFFKHDNFYEEHITVVKVIATSSDIHILMHPPNIKGVMLECHSKGWFPKPHMEWRDSKGNFIQATSESHLQDNNKIFTMKMALLIKANSHWNVTCFIQNLITHQEESISIVLPGKLFSWRTAWILILSISSIVLIAFYIPYSVKLHSMCVAEQHKSTPRRERDLDLSSRPPAPGTTNGGECVQQILPLPQQGVILLEGLVTLESMPNHDNEQCEADQFKGSSYNRISPWIKSTILFIMSVLSTPVVMLILHLKQRVPDSDQYFELDTLWLEDISVILCVLIMINSKLMLLIYFRLCGYKYKKQPYKYKILRFSHFLFFTITFGIILLDLQFLNKVLFSDPQLSMCKSWMRDMTIIVVTLLVIFNIKSSAKLLLHIARLTYTSIPDCWEHGQASQVSKVAT
ncbi:selection and upkeep of intraepithelial T-cells protein 2-like isoform X2 [Mastomys coucha]|uniref:selection and upkeep of intraepithelial T-cells protein 2-like isoform X2 n=1 Tax=Mastomys coucha TaxID=35658 RepID=UPI0012615DEE|nr:selection and upkeep of intraepithelial T-cells protein 2-like isoform X2 [Mastomys coucha]